MHVAIVSNTVASISGSPMDPLIVARRKTARSAWCGHPSWHAAKRQPLREHECSRSVIVEEWEHFQEAAIVSRVVQYPQLDAVEFTGDID